MNTMWAQRREEVLSDCLVSPDLFTQMVNRLGEFVVPYQQALETEAAQHHMHLYLQGLLSHLPRKNAEDIAAWVDVERQVMQDFIGCVPGSTHSIFNRSVRLIMSTMIRKPRAVMLLSSPPRIP